MRFSEEKGNDIITSDDDNDDEYETHKPYPNADINKDFASGSSDDLECLG